MSLPDWWKFAIAALVLLFVVPVVWRIVKRFGMLLFLRTAVKAGLSDIGRKALAQQPDVIRLEPCAAPQWKDAPAMEAMAQPLLNKGFTDCGAFTVDKMPGVKIWILFQEHTWVAAHLYEHPKAGMWPELVTRYTNGASHSITTMPATGIRPPAWITTIRSPKAPTDTLYERLVRERSEINIEHVVRDEVARAFEAAYSRQMIAMKNEGISPEEVAAVAKKWAEKKIASA